MPWPFSLLIPSLWGAWLIYWRIAAFGAKPTQRSESVGPRLSHLLPLLLGGALLGLPRFPGSIVEGRLVPASPAWLWSATALLAIGLGIAVLARMRLGGNWSGLVTLKQDHELIRSGPYRFVRHPIYSGLILALTGTAFSLGTARALLGLALMVAAFVRRTQVEDRLMAEQFGAAHAHYCAEVPALIPFVF